MVMLTEAIKLTLFPAVMAFAASSDFFTMTIANRVSLILVAGFASARCPDRDERCRRCCRMSPPPPLVLAVVFVFFSRGWIGGGDAKLAAATALWLGFAHLADYLLYASLFGGALTLLIDPISRAAAAAGVRRPGWAERLHRRGGGVPYGIALAAAALLVYPQTEWMAAIGR